VDEIDLLFLDIKNYLINLGNQGGVIDWPYIFMLFEDFRKKKNMPRKELPKKNEADFATIPAFSLPHNNLKK
jgi:hypothetical protein